jgi:hypothetical protein
MPFDPTLPANGSLISSAELRTQMNALNDAILTIIASGAITGVMVDGVGTESPGSPAWASATLDGSGILRFNFGIPQGFPGEVTQAQLSNDLANTSNFCIQQSLNQSSNNSNAITTLDTPFVDPDVEAVRQKLNELILGLRR